MKVLERRTFKQWEIVTLISLVIGLIGIALMFAYGWNETGMRHLLRVTGRASFPLFVMTAVASSVAILFPSSVTRWLYANRKFTGLAFAVTYLYHAFGIIGLIVLIQSPGIEGLELVLSILAYVFLVPMVVTSFRAVRQRMSRWAWDSLHSVGMLVIWYFFLQEFIHKSEEVHGVFYGILAVVTALVLPLKVIALAKPTGQDLKET